MTNETDFKDLADEELLVETPKEHEEPKEDQKEIWGRRKRILYILVVGLLTIVLVALLIWGLLLVLADDCLPIHTTGNEEYIDPIMFTTVWDYPYKKQKCTTVFTTAYADHPATDAVWCVTFICRY